MWNMKCFIIPVIDDDDDDDDDDGEKVAGD
jgi:hypothetical protein